MASLLDRFDEMNRRPFGTNTALSNGTQYGAGGSAGSQFRRQGQAYGQALRILNRQARRGDPRSALSAIAVRNQANAEGYSPGGIQNAAEQNAGIEGRVGAMDWASQARESAAAGQPQGSRILARRQGLTTPAAAPLPVATPPIATSFAPTAEVTNPPQGFQPVGSRILDRITRFAPQSAASAPVGRINGLPASQAIAQATTAADLARAPAVDPVAAYQADLEAYQAGLSGSAPEGASASAISRINDRYAAASDLDKARMVGAQLKRQSRILNRQRR